MTGLAIETATEHVELRVESDDGVVLAERSEDVGHGHTRRLTPLIRETLADASVAARDLAWIAADVGPGSFTGVRVGIATAAALAMVSRAQLLGASSLAALAHAAQAGRSLVVPLVPAGRREVYAGFFYTDRSGAARLFEGPCVGTVDVVLDRVAEARAVLGAVAVRFVGPGAARERESLERAWPGSADPPFRADGLSAADLSRAARLGGGPALGLLRADAPLEPAYVRTAQADSRARHRALAGTRYELRTMTNADVDAVVAIERRVFPDPWPASFFLSELRQPEMFARVAEREGRLAGYSLTWLGPEFGHLGNIAVAPEQRRRGVAGVLLDELLARAVATNVQSLALEVRVSNAAAQELYRNRGFRVAGLRRRYYRDDAEDALVMEWRPRPPS